MKLFCNNKTAISIANNPVQHDKTKHVEIDKHFIKEKLDDGSICISYISSSQQIVDILTKGLPRQNFDLCVSKLGLYDIYIPTRGGVLEIMGSGHVESPWVAKIYFVLIFILLIRLVLPINISPFVPLLLS